MQVLVMVVQALHPLPLPAQPAKALPGQGLLQGKDDVHWWIISGLFDE